MIRPPSKTSVSTLPMHTRHAPTHSYITVHSQTYPYISHTHPCTRLDAPWMFESESHLLCASASTPSSSSSHPLPRHGSESNRPLLTHQNSKEAKVHHRNDSDVETGKGHKHHEKVAAQGAMYGYRRVNNGGVRVLSLGTTEVACVWSLHACGDVCIRRFV